MKSKLIGADWILPMTGSDPIRHGIVAVEGAQVAWVGAKHDLPDRYRATMVDWLSGVMTPGLVNAHTHLQYTCFDAVGRRQYCDFEHWCEDFEEAYDAVQDPATWAEAARRGVRLGQQTGTTVFSEIVTDDAARGALTCGCAAGIEFLEVIAETDQSWRDGGRERFLTRLAAPSQSRVGISPHAPYSVDPTVVTDLADIARDRQLRLHTHLGESASEDALYLAGNTRVLDIYGCLKGQFMLAREGGRGLRAADLAHSLNLLSPACHIAHGVYLDRSQRDVLRQQGTRVALCPRSNATIGLAEAPVAAYLSEGHDICVGTDSLASAPSLDLMGDVKLLATIARRQGYDSADLYDRLMTAATVAGARALGVDAEGYGTLRAGGPADIAIFDVPVEDGDVQEALVTQGEGRCILTLSAGEPAFDPRTSKTSTAAASVSGGIECQT